MFNETIVLDRFCNKKKFYINILYMEKNVYINVKYSYRKIYIDI